MSFLGPYVWISLIRNTSTPDWLPSTSYRHSLQRVPASPYLFLKPLARVPETFEYLPLMSEISSCGLDMSQFKEGDFCKKYLGSNQLTDMKDLEGTWEDLKKISQSIDPILAASGVGFFKRKATAVATLRTEIKLKSVDSKGNPCYYFKTYYPLGITKDCNAVADGSISDLPDPDTCHWKAQTVWCNGRLIQKRSGSNGTMYDSRIVLKSHPDGGSSEHPIMLFLWTMIDSKGQRHQAHCWMKKIAE